MSRVEEAYEVIRAHHHEHPYLEEPSRVYSDLGSLSQLLAALGHLTEDMAGAAQGAIDADDRQKDARLFSLWRRLEEARGNLSAARQLIDEAHIDASHLIFHCPPSGNSGD